MRIRIVMLCLCLFAASSWVRGLTLEEIVRLSQAGAAEKTLVKLIESSEIEFPLTLGNVILLQSAGVTDSVILAIAAKTPLTDDESDESSPYRMRTHRREYTPFDRFYLSTYYSHQYGWPLPNYRNPRDLLETGLYCSPPEHYPDARYVRVYGWGYSYSPRTRIWSIAPYSRVVPRNSLQQHSATPRLIPRNSPQQPSATQKKGNRR